MEVMRRAWRKREPRSSPKVDLQSEPRYPLAMMRWESDEDDSNILLLLGEDTEGELIELGRVEPGSPGFWRWSSQFAMGSGGADSQASAKKLLIGELKATREMLLFNLEGA